MNRIISVMSVRMFVFAAKLLRIQPVIIVHPAKK